MDQSVLSTNVPSLLQASATILDNLQIAIDAVESEQAKVILDNLYSAADHFNDLALFILSNCSTSQQALKDAHISTETIEVITGVLKRSKDILDPAVEFSQVVCGNADRDENNSSNDNDGISAIIQELESDYTALLKGVVIGTKGLDVILSLTQVWLDVAFKAKPTVLGLSLAILQESITSLNNLTSGPDSSSTPFSSLCRAAQSVHSSISTSNLDTITPPAVMVASGARNLFHTYIGQGDYDEVKELLDVGIDAMSPGPQGLHPVHFAAYCGELEIVRLLAQYGADTWAVSGPNGETPLLLAAAAGNLDVVEFLMEQEGADVDCVSDMHGATALLCACDYGHLDVVRFLVVGRKANLFIADKEGSTPLMKAVRAQHRELVGLLLENVHLELPDRSKEDGTIDDDVRAETIQRDLTAAKLFLEVGATDLSVSGQEKTPLQEAIGHGVDGLLEYLLSEALKAMDLDIGSKDGQLGHPLNALGEQDYRSDVRDEVRKYKLELEEQAQHFTNDIEDLEHLGASATIFDRKSRGRTRA